MNVFCVSPLYFRKIPLHQQKKIFFADATCPLFSKKVLLVAFFFLFAVFAKLYLKNVKNKTTKCSLVGNTKINILTNQS